MWRRVWSLLKRSFTTICFLRCIKSFLFLLLVWFNWIEVVISVSVGGISRSALLVTLGPRPPLSVFFFALRSLVYFSACTWVMHLLATRCFLGHLSTQIGPGHSTQVKTESSEIWICKHFWNIACGLVHSTKFLLIAFFTYTEKNANVFTGNLNIYTNLLSQYCDVQYALIVVYYCTMM